MACPIHWRILSLAAKTRRCLASMSRRRAVVTVTVHCSDTTSQNELTLVAVQIPGSRQISGNK
jgi:hypothetical protein